MFCFLLHSARLSSSGVSIPTMRAASSVSCPAGAEPAASNGAGAGGYGGVGISELLLAHPGAEIAALVDVENVGVPPDVEVVMYPKEVIAGQDPQLEKAIELEPGYVDRHLLHPALRRRQQRQRPLRGFHLRPWRRSLCGYRLERHPRPAWQLQLRRLRHPASDLA